MADRWPSIAEWAAICDGFIAGASGFGQRDIDWQENAGRPDSPDDMATEIAYVQLNSGMKHAIAVKLWPGILKAIEADKPADQIPFGHVGKRNAMRWVWERRFGLFAELSTVDDESLPAWCQVTLPWIGPITCYHLAKNWGAQVAKPDVWLQRAADRTGETPQQLCERISAMCGLKVPTVDLIIWAALKSGALSISEIREPTNG